MGNGKNKQTDQDEGTTEAATGKSERTLHRRRRQRRQRRRRRRKEKKEGGR